MAHREGNTDDQVSSTTQEIDSEDDYDYDYDYDMSTTDFSTSDEEMSPVECADASVGTSDSFKEEQKTEAPFKIRGSPNDDVKNKLGFNRSVSTQTHPADFVEHPEGITILYPVDSADACVGTSDWSHDSYGEQQSGAAFNTSCLPNDDDTDELGLNRSVFSLSTPTDPAKFVENPQRVTVPYPHNSSTSRVYNSEGIHIVTGLDLCDCNVKECPGCHPSCIRCGSCKCGSTCRRNRSY